MNRKYVFAGLLMAMGMLVILMSGTVAASANPSQAAAQKDSHKNTSSQNSNQVQEDGQRVFDQNCSRCHTAPDGFSPRISKTVVRHMRMRANLSADDERALLRFFNP